MNPVHKQDYDRGDVEIKPAPERIAHQICRLGSTEVWRLRQFFRHTLETLEKMLEDSCKSKASTRFSFRFTKTEP